MSSSLYKEHEYNAVVVDRERDVSLVTGLLYNLEYHRRSLSGLTSDPSYRLTLGFAPHSFGSGKTTFVKHFLRLVRRLGDSCLRYSSSNPSARSFLDKLKNAAYLYVDLSKLEPTEPKERNLKWAVYYLMVKSACVNMGVQLLPKKEVYELVEMEPLNLVPLLRRILNMPPEQFLLVAFDEVGILDTKGRFFDLEVTVDGRIRPYNDFFRIIRELCKQPGLFFIVVGKSEGLSIQNYVSSVSRVLLKFIPLAPLQLHSIEEHLQQSTMLSSSGQSVADVLCNDNFSSNELAEMLLDFTGGVPGLMTRAIDQLLIHVRENGGLSLSKQECFDFLNRKDVQESCVSSYLPRLYDLSEERSKILNMLIMMSLYHIRFRPSDTLKVKRSVHDPNGVSASVFDLVTDMCLYLRECNPPEVQQYSGMIFYEVWIPKMLSSYIEDSTSQSRLERILLSTIRSQPMEYFYQSKCRVFEGLVATRLYLMFSIGCVDDAMADTLSRLVTNWNEMNLRFSPDCILYFMNSIHYSVASGESSRKTFGRNQWRLIVERVLEYQKIYIPIEPTSHSPDILFQLHAKSGENRILFGIACKGRWSSGGIQWKNIIEEAEKFLIPVSEQVLSVHPSLHCVLVIISTKLSSSVSNAIEHTSCVYSAGSLIDNQLRIPPRCQLVILSEEDVEAILGKQVLSGLSSAFTISSDPVLKDIGISALEEFVGFMKKRLT